MTLNVKENTYTLTLEEMIRFENKLKEYEDDLNSKKELIEDLLESKQYLNLEIVNKSNEIVELDNALLSAQVRNNKLANTISKLKKDKKMLELDLTVAIRKVNKISEPQKRAGLKPMPISNSESEHKPILTKILEIWA